MCGIAGILLNNSNKKLIEKFQKFLVNYHIEDLTHLLFIKTLKICFFTLVCQ